MGRDIMIGKQTGPLLYHRFMHDPAAFLLAKFAAFTHFAKKY